MGGGLVQIDAKNSVMRVVVAVGASSTTKIPVDNLFVMLDRSDSYLYLYNTEGMLSLHEGEADIVRFRECQEYLDRH